jgi:phosphoribosylglycinamide formyltransferase-1
VRLAVLISGTGRSLTNLLQAIALGELSAEIVGVVSSKPDVRGLDLAREARVPTAVVVRRDYADDDSFSEGIYTVIEPLAPDLLICAGFLRKLVVPDRWEGRILNIHPGLIGESRAAGKGFYGEHVHRAVIESGDQESGATVHVVDNDYDHGPVVMQVRVPVVPADSADDLAARVFEAECKLYPKAIAAYVDDHPDLVSSP